MTGDTVECFNCGRPNPQWAQVCRSCGVGLRATAARAPGDRFPRDRESLISMAAVVATIVVAVIIGSIIANMNPTSPTVGVGSPSPEPTPVPTATPRATPEETPEPEPEDTPEPTPELRGTLAFGTGLDENQDVTGETDTFTPSTNFAYSLRVPGGVGGTPVRNEISRTSEPEEVVLDDPLNVDPEAEVVAHSLGTASDFVSSFGPGDYIWRVYVDDELIAEAPLTLAEG